MKLLKIIFCLLFSFFSIQSVATVRIVYVNGAFNYRISTAKEAFDKFETVLNKNYVYNLPNIKEKVSSELHFIVANTFLPGAEVGYQQSNSGLAIVMHGSQYYGYPSYEQALGKVYFDELASAYYTDSVKTRALSQTKRLYEKVIKYIDEGDKVILVGHSQGSLFTEAAASMLVYKRPDLSSKLSMVSFAAPAYSNKSNLYLNIEQDKTVYTKGGTGAWRLFENTAFHPFVANVVACVSPCINNSTTESMNLIKFTGDDILHTATMTYLNEGVLDFQTKIAIPTMLTDKIKTAIFRVTSNAKVSSITIPSKISSASFSYFAKIFGILDAVAQSFPNLYAYINSSYTIRVDGTGFNGNEAISIAGSTCNTSTIQRGSGYFTQQCTSGSVAGDANKVRVYDTQYDLDIEVPVAYQTMSLRGPILAPNAPTLADLGSGSVRVTWGAVAGVSSYEVYRGATLVRTLAADTPTFTDTGLTTGASACYRIRAIASGTASASSGETCITPAAPAVKCAGQWTTGQYNLGQTEQQTQACSTGYTGSKVLTHTCQAGAAGSATGTWSATSTQDNCVVVAPVTCLGTWSSTRYNVGQVEEQFANTCPAGSQGQVRTFHTCQAGGSWSANAQSDTCVATLIAPTGLSASSVSAAQNGVAGIQLVWTAVSGATRYYITRNGSSNYSSQVGTNWTDPNVTAGVQYCYTVNAFSSLNNATSPESSQVCATYQPTQVSVSPPTNLTAAQYTTGGRKDIRLTWTPPSPAPDSYMVFRRDRTGVLAPLGGSDISFFDRYELNLTSGISYCYFIRAEKGGTSSTDSNEACSLAP